MRISVQIDKGNEKVTLRYRYGKRLFVISHKTHPVIITSIFYFTNHNNCQICTNAVSLTVIILCADKTVLVTEYYGEQYDRTKLEKTKSNTRVIS